MPHGVTDLADHARAERPDLTVYVGSAADLSDALRRGSDLRLFLTTDTYEETLYFQQTYAGDGEAVAGLMSHHHSFVHHGQPVDGTLHQYLPI